jgi:glycosyltransferase involved in cell wall biosynthesis
MNKIKVILSTGIGPLHFMKSAVYLMQLVDLKVIQSWIPKNTDGLFVRVLSRLIGHKHLSTGLKKRTPKELEGRNFSCTFPDFFLWGFNFISSKLNYPNKKIIAGCAWYLYGRQSCKFITNADVFHVRSGAGQGGAILKAKKESMKVIVDHSIAHPAYMDKYLSEEYVKNGEVFDLGMESPLFQFTVNDAEMADLLLVNSTFVKNTFLEFGYPSDKIRVVYLGVRDDFFGLKTIYKAQNKIKLLFTGGFGFRKGGEYLLQALQILENEGFQFEMKIVGDYSQAHQLMKKYPVKSILFVGFVPQDELKSYLQESDIYVFPSLCEGCASSGMEALAAGLPVIATVESGFPIEHEKDGIIIPSKNSLFIANAIKLLANDENKRRFLGMNASQKIQQNYTWRNYALQLESVYSELLNNL